MSENSGLPRLAIVGCVSSFSHSLEQPEISGLVLVLILNFDTDSLQAHGSLDQIYADVKVECEKRGWDTVDAVILGGDTQVLSSHLVRGTWI